MFCPITEKKHFSCELRMWCFTAAAWLTAMARVRSLARELPYDSGVAKKLKKKKKKRPFQAGVQIVLGLFQTVWMCGFQRATLGVRFLFQ